ncbi:MAG: hypothetical protein ACPGWR_08265 [Ardenticatenaceae bacterium]
MGGRRQRIYGTDVFREIAPPESTKPFEASYWDLWFVVVLEAKFEGDWGQMAGYFREEDSPGYRSEKMLNHMVHLQERMDEAGVSVGDFVGDVALFKKEKPRAKRKVLESYLNEQDMSYWMKHTPRVEREARAMRGYWGHFPISPAVYEDELAKKFKKGGYSYSQTFALERKLRRFLDKRAKKASLEQSAALFRAFLTVMLERIEQVALSGDAIASLYRDIFNRYVALPRDHLNMSPEYFFQDVIELIIWEDYGMTDEITKEFFANLVPVEVPAVEAIWVQILSPPTHIIVNK